MKFTQFAAALGASAFLFAGTVEAKAHAHLVTSIPAAKAVVASPVTISVAFNENLEAKFSGFDVTSAAGAKIALAPTLDPKDKKMLVAAPQAPLAPGVYKLAWHVVGSDGHKIEGAYDFTVK